MSEQMILIILASLVVFMGFLSYYFWQKYLHSYKRLQFSLSSEKNYIAENARSIKKLKYLESDLDQSRSSVERLKTERRSLSEFTDELKEDFEAKVLEMESSIRALTSSNQHFEKQTEVLLQQLKEIDEQKRDLRLQLQKEQEEIEQKIKAINLKHQSEIKELNTKITTDKKERLRLLKMIEHLEKKVKIADPKLLDRLSKRLKHYQHFYRVALSKKEMLEERIDNWELALKLLSKWVLFSQARLKKDEENLCELVGSALECIKKGSLVEDEFSQPAQS